MLTKEEAKSLFNLGAQRLNLKSPGHTTSEFPLKAFSRDEIDFARSLCTRYAAAAVTAAAAHCLSNWDRVHAETT